MKYWPAVVVCAVLCTEFLSCEDTCSPSSGSVQLSDIHCERLGKNNHINCSLDFSSHGQRQDISWRMYWKNGDHYDSLPKDSCSSDVSEGVSWKSHPYACHGLEWDSCKFENQGAVCFNSVNMRNCTVVMAVFPKHDSKDCSCFMKHFDMDEIVKPLPVDNLSSEPVEESTKIKIIWDKPNDYRDLIYQIKVFPPCSTVECKKQPPELPQTFITYNTSILIPGLKPHQNYTVVVRARIDEYSRQRGHWSEEVERLVETAEDVPASAPILSPGSFEVTPDKTVIYWKPIPSSERNGVLTTITITYTSGDEIFSQNVTETTRTAARVRNVRPSSEKEEICLTAATSKGYNHSPNCLIIKRAKRPSIKDFVVKYNQSSSQVLFSWEPVGGTYNYTIYWCRGKSEMTSDTEDMRSESEHCRFGSALDWKHISVESGSYQEDQDHFAPYSVDELRFAISAEDEASNISSGLHFADCLYDATKDFVSPEAVSFAERQIVNSLSLTWDYEDCEPGKSAYVKEYLFKYSVSGTEHMEEKSVHPKKKHIKLEGLKPEKTYHVWVQSSTNGATSSPVYVGKREILKEDSHNAVTIGIAVAVTLIILLVICCLSWYIWKKLKKTIAQIKMPDMESEIPENIKATDPRSEDGEDLMPTCNGHMNSQDSAIGPSLNTDDLNSSGYIKDGESENWDDFFKEKSKNEINSKDLDKPFNIEVLQDLLPDHMLPRNKIHQNPVNAKGYVQAPTEEPLMRQNVVNAKGYVEGPIQELTMQQNVLNPNGYVQAPTEEPIVDYSVIKHIPVETMGDITKCAIGGEKINNMATPVVNHLGYVTDPSYPASAEPINLEESFDKRDKISDREKVTVPLIAKHCEQLPSDDDDNDDDDDEDASAPSIELHIDEENLQINKTPQVTSSTQPEGELSANNQPLLSDRSPQGNPTASNTHEEVQAEKCTNITESCAEKDYENPGSAEILSPKVSFSDKEISPSNKSKPTNITQDTQATNLPGGYITPSEMMSMQLQNL